MVYLSFQNGWNVRRKPRGDVISWREKFAKKRVDELEANFSESGYQLETSWQVELDMVKSQLESSLKNMTIDSALWRWIFFNEHLFLEITV